MMEKRTNKGAGGQTRPIFKEVADGSRKNVGNIRDPKGTAKPSGPKQG